MPCRLPLLRWPRKDPLYRQQQLHVTRANNCAAQHRGNRVLLPLQQSLEEGLLRPHRAVCRALHVGNRDITMIDSDQPVIISALRVEKMEANSASYFAQQWLGLLIH